MAVVCVVLLVAEGCGSSKKESASSTSTTAASAASSSSGCGSGTKSASAPGVTADTIKIGLLSDFTGVAASTFADTANGVEARVALENAKGGVCGRKIEIVKEDTTSSPNGALTAVQKLISDKVFGVIGYSAFLFGGYRPLQEQGIPVTGGGFDGVEWGQKPNTNMFSYTGGIDPTSPTSTLYGEFLKSRGATNVGGVAYGISASSINSVKGLKVSVEKAGLKMGYTNLSFPFGGTDFGPVVLDMKSAGVDAAVCSCVQNSNLALITTAKQNGLTLKAEVSFSGADSSVFSNPTAKDAAQGAYFPTATPLDLHLKPVDEYVANLKKYDPAYKGGYPSLGVSGGYFAADLMIRGLEEAGLNPTREAFIQNLTKVTDYDAGGILPSKVGFDHFGTAQSRGCSYFVQVKGNDFVTVKNPAGGYKFCGDLIPGSGVAS